MRQPEAPGGTTPPASVTPAAGGTGMLGKDATYAAYAPLSPDQTKRFNAFLHQAEALAATVVQITSPSTTQEMALLRLKEATLMVLSAIEHEEPHAP